MEPFVAILLIVTLGVLLAAGGLLLARRANRAPEEDSYDEQPKGTVRAAPAPVIIPPETTVAPWIEEPAEDFEPEPEFEPDGGPRFDAAAAEPDAVAEVIVPARLRDRMGRTRAAFAGLVTGLTGRSRIDDDTWGELEESLILADVGVATTAHLMEELRAEARAAKIDNPAELIGLLKGHLVGLLAGANRTLVLVPDECNVWMFVGVNGVGKTTTIAKLAQQEVAAGRTVVLAAADTFRAAAAEQLAHWAERTGAAIVRGEDGADPGSIVFDAMSAAHSRHADLVLVDTAGRLHTKVNLMGELKKLRRIVERTPGALKEVLLVLDATTGQNGLMQAKQFAEAVDVTGVVLTKLDGTAKGGIVLAIQRELGLPVKVVGVGEGAGDLIPFDPDEFVDALFG